MNQAWRLLGRALFWLGWPALYIYLRRSARTRVYVIADDQVLLVNAWLSDGSWALPGGGLHRGEQPADGAVREVREETGIVLQPSALVQLGKGWRSSRGLKSYQYVFAILMSEPIKPHRQRGEIQAVRWFRLDELLNPALKTEVRRALALLAGSK